MTLAQGTDIVLLDEPIAFHDLSHAVRVLDLVDRLCVERSGLSDGPGDAAAR